jgi:hypothetical protein
MKKNPISMWLLRFARQQPLYLMIAAGAAGIIWATTGHAPSLTVTLTYSFLCGNFTVLALENVHIPSSWRRASWSWLLYLILLFVITPIAVTAATLVVFILVPPALVPPAPRTSFGDFLLAAWKFPAVANLIFGKRMPFLLDNQVPSGRSESSTAAGYQFRSVREGTRRCGAQASS